MSVDHLSENLQGKVAIVTGAASGIGLAITQQLTEFGVSVVAEDIDPAVIVDGRSSVVDQNIQLAKSIAGQCDRVFRRLLLCNVADYICLARSVWDGDTHSSVDHPDGPDRVTCEV